MQKKVFQTLSRFFYFSLVLLILFFSATKVFAQQMVDKTVVSIGDGTRTELITYSDLLWQLALQPDVVLNPASSEDLNRALQTIINQRLIALEAQRLPNVAPTESEVKEEIKRILERFPSTANFEQRLRIVGFNSINDDNFQQLMEQRVAINKYLDFRFRSFVVITPEDEAKYYRETYTPDFRRRNPGLLLPPLEDVKTQINKILSEGKIEEDIERFLDDSKRRTSIIVLSEV